MANSEEKIEQGLKTLFSFAYLHKWCTQLDELIVSFLESVGEKNRKRISELIIQNYTGRSETKEQLVLALVLLKRLGEKSKPLTENLYRMLNGRLDINDQNFLRFHLFQDQHPLPSDIAYDISSRHFFSFKRAINRGMKIDLVTSSFDPQSIALYLTLIMCRFDLHEQNRAMLSFLLYRIDADLPQNVLDGIFDYLKSLKGIIADLEAKGDSALSEEFDYADEPVIEHREREEIPDIEPGSGRANEGLTFQGDEDTVRPPHPQDRPGYEPGARTARKDLESSTMDEGMPLAARENDRVSEAEARRSGDFFGSPPLSTDDRTGDKGGISADTREGRGPKGGYSFAGAGDDRKEADYSALFGVGGGPEQTGDERLKDPSSKSSQGGGMSSTGSNLSGSNVPEEGDEDSGNPSSYTIRFNKNVKELLKIIEELEKEIEATEKQEPKPGKSGRRPVEEEPQKAAAEERAESPETREARPIKIDQKEAGPSSRRLGWWPILAGAVAAVLLVLVLVLNKGDADSKTAVVSGAPAAEAVEPMEEQPRVGQPVMEQTEFGRTAARQPQAEQPDTVQSWHAQNVGSAFLLSSSGAGPVWTVRQGQCMWDLYRAAGDGIPYGEGTYRVPGSLIWLEFILDVFEVNPELDQFKIIYPGQELVLPDYHSGD